MATQLPTSAEVIDPTQTNAQQKADFAAMLDFLADHLAEGTTGGTSTAFTLTPTPAITAYAVKQSFNITTHIASGVSPTLNINGLGATLNIVRRLQDGSYLNVDGLPAGVYRATIVSGTQILFENVRPLTVGTVSQSGGVPTGSMIERGSNANGEYVRWADGTQICWVSFAAASRSITTALGSMFTLSAPVGRTFPIAFSAVPTVSPTLGASSSGRVFAVPINASTATWTYDLMSPTSVTSTVSEAYIAIGRWF